MKKYIFLFSLVLFSFSLLAQEDGQVRTSSYFHFTGTIGKSLNITADLTIVNDTAISGYYSYDSYGIPIMLRGKIFLDNEVQLYEYNKEWEKTAELKGFFEQSKITGTFQNLKTNKKFPFIFNVSADPSCMAFKGYSLCNKKYLNNSNAGPVCTVNYNVLFPEKYKNKVVQDSVFIYIKNTYFSGSLINDPVKLLNDNADSAFASYLTTNSDTINMGNALFMLSWDFDEDVKVIYNANDILSLEFSAYYYTGGAHGGYGSIFKNIDLKSGKTILLKDLLKPGYQDALSSIITKALKQQYGMTETTKLSDNGFFVETIDPSSNFYLTKKGIGFVYNPYEIACYANGMIDIFVPFSDMEAIVK